MRFVTRYEIAEGVTGDDIMRVFPAHQARWQEFRERGELLMIGPFSDRRGALAVFTTREAAEAFMATDPFVTEGLVGASFVHEWNEVLQPDLA